MLRILAAVVNRKGAWKRLWFRGMGKWWWRLHFLGAVLNLIKSKSKTNVRWTRRSAWYLLVDTWSDLKRMENICLDRDLVRGLGLSTLVLPEYWGQLQLSETGWSWLHGSQACWVLFQHSTLASSLVTPVLAWRQGCWGAWRSLNMHANWLRNSSTWIPGPSYIGPRQTAAPPSLHLKCSYQSWCWEERQKE